MKTINLGVADRISIEALFPKKGGRIEMSLVRDIVNKLNFTPEEVRDFQMTDGPNGLIRWNLKTEQLVQFDFTDEQIEIIKKGIKRIDDQGEVSLMMLALIEKIEE